MISVFNKEFGVKAGLGSLLKHTIIQAGEGILGVMVRSLHSCY